MTGEALTQGVVNLTIRGTPIRVYSPMKTVAHLLKCRNKLGVQSAVAALKASIESGNYNRQKLIHFAGICRVKRIVMEYADEAEQDARAASQATVGQAPAAVWDRDLLQQQVWSEPLKQLARKYGVSDVALAKRCKRMNIPLPGRGYWAKKHASDI